MIWIKGNHAAKAFELNGSIVFQDDQTTIVTTIEELREAGWQLATQTLPKI